MNLYNILAWIVFGLIAGFIAKAIMPGRDSSSTIVTIILGIVGALVGGFIGDNFLGGTNANNTGTGFSIGSLVMAVIGAIVVLAIYRLATGRNLST